MLPSHMPDGFDRMIDRLCLHKKWPLSHQGGLMSASLISIVLNLVSTHLSNNHVYGPTNDPSIDTPRLSASHAFNSSEISK